MTGCGPAWQVRARRRVVMATAVAALGFGLILGLKLVGGRGLAAAAAQGPGGCPPPATSTTPAPTPPGDLSRPPAGELIACVGTMAIDGATVGHWYTVASKSAGKGSGPKPTAALLIQVMQFLISADWIMGEAAERNVVVTDAQVRRQFLKIKRQQFNTRREFRRFLRQSGQTVTDLLLRVRLDLLSTKLRDRVAPHGDQKALDRFVREFQAEWPPRTYCLSGYVVMDCGHQLPAS